MGQEIIFEAKHMHKRFGSTVALKDVDFQLKRGEIRGLVGENGSGKSTIMSIASGMQEATSGEMYFKGEAWNPKSMVESQKKGISMILQEANTIPGVTVAQNLFAGRENLFTVCGIIDMKKMYQQAEQLLKKFGITNIHARDLIDQYTFEDRKLIEIVRCVTDDTEILVVDETTTALSMSGRKILYDLIHKMAEEKGKAVVFISHDMDEILEQCSCLTVLRDGEIIGTLDHEQMMEEGAVKKIRYMMVGREIGEKFYREDYDSSCREEVALELRHITCGPVKDFNLTLHRGEIIGIGGLSGCGMHDVGRIAFGLEKLEEGQVLCSGENIKNCLQAIQAGIGYISKNRDTEALILTGTIQENIVLPSLKKIEKNGVIHPMDEKRLSEEQIEAFRIKCNNGKQNVNTLSGGNKQKVSFAKWTANNSEVLIMDCPTRGVDIGVKQFMYSLIAKMKAEGKAILMISEELSELIGMADRIIIMKEFQIRGEFKRSAGIQQTDLIEYMI